MKRIWFSIAVFALAIASPNGAFAVDGVILINQTNAILGNVTPGDLPGFPVQISQSGSYRLSSNLVVPDASTDAIDITGNDVTLDLNGFSIIGPTICSGAPATCSPAATGRGIQVDGSNVAIFNGTIRGMGLGILGATLQLQNIRVIGNYSGGINAPHSSNISSCSARFNGGIGIYADGVIIGNTAIGNGQDGFEFSDGTTANNNTSLSNNGRGFFGTGTISGNIAARNTGAGIETVCPSTIVGNNLYQNHGAANLLIDPGGPSCVLANNSVGN